MQDKKQKTQYQTTRKIDTKSKQRELREQLANFAKQKNEVIAKLLTMSTR